MPRNQATQPNPVMPRNLVAGKPACGLLIVLTAVLTACGGDSGEISPVRLLHSPPIGQLTPQQLRSLSMECEKYPPHDSMRGRYDAAYCEAALAAWSDAPLQMVTIDSAGAGEPKPVNPSKTP
jgi:hypothetical protein